MKKKKLLIISLIIIILLPLIVFGKYLYYKTYEFYLTTNNFYFYSNYLSLDNKKFTINNWGGSGNYNISVDLYNYSNDLKYTSDDIEYEVTCNSSSNVTCSVNNGSGVLYGNMKGSKDVGITIIPKEDLKTGDEVEVEVIAKSKTIYNKILKATFKILVTDIDYNIVDSSGSLYASLDISNLGDVSKEVTLTFDNSKVNIDTTNKLVINGTNTNKNGFISSSVITLEPGSDYSIYFYKKDISKNYSLLENKNVITVSQ